MLIDEGLDLGDLHLDERIILRNAHELFRAHACHQSGIRHAAKLTSESVHIAAMFVYNLF